MTAETVFLAGVVSGLLLALATGLGFVVGVVREGGGP
jgi:hypothetical protein